MKRILIIEPNEKYAQRLLTVLKAANLYAISMVKTMREAALLLAQQPHDLALAPLSDGENLIKSLRSVQADLRVVLTTATADASARKNLPAGAQGLLLMPLLEVDLPRLVSDALEQELKPVAPTMQKGGVNLDLTPIKDILQEYHWAEPVQAAVLAYGPKRLVSWGVLSKPDMSALASRVDHDWRSEPRQPDDAQIQFWGGDGASVSPFIVYTRATIYGLLLSVVSVSQLTIAELRLQADGVAEQLAELALPPAPPNTPVVAEPLTPPPPPALPKVEPAEEEMAGATAVPTTTAPTATEPTATVDTAVIEPASAPAQPVTGPLSGGKTYAAIWRSAAPLPEPILLRLEDIFQEIGRENGCAIKHVLLRPDISHLVVACPPGRNSVWLVHLLKRESESRIAAEFETDMELWAKGYYASESGIFLSESEIQLFLEKERA
jgi:CheY-like chemotaxis protein